MSNNTLHNVTFHKRLQRASHKTDKVEVIGGVTKLVARRHPVVFDTVIADDLATPDELAVALVMDGFVAYDDAAAAAQAVAVALSVRRVPYVAHATGSSHRSQVGVRVAEGRRLFRIDEIRAAHLV